MKHLASGRKPLWMVVLTIVLTSASLLGCVLGGPQLASRTPPPACEVPTPNLGALAPEEELFVDLQRDLGWPGHPHSDIICVLRASDGALSRRYEFGSAFLSAMVQDHGVLYLLENGGVCAGRASDGSQLWCTLQEQFPTGLHVQEGRVYVSGKEGVFALEAATGTVLWKDASPGRLAVAGGTVYRAAQSLSEDGRTQSDQLCALEASTGTVRWCATYPFGTISALVADEGQVYLLLAGPANLLHATFLALRAADGMLQWQQTLSIDPNLSTVVLLQDGLLFLSTQITNGSGSVSAVRASDGSLLWTYSANQRILGLASDQGHLYVSTYLTVEALESTSGASLWSKETDKNFDHLSVRDDQLYLVVGSELSVLRASTGASVWENSACKDATSPAARQPFDDHGVLYWCHWPTEWSGLLPPAPVLATGK